jgi:hypothetical protein
MAILRLLSLVTINFLIYERGGKFEQKKGAKIWAKNGAKI